MDVGGLGVSPGGSSLGAGVLVLTITTGLEVELGVADELGRYRVAVEEAVGVGVWVLVA